MTSKNPLKTPTFEESIDLINYEIAKRKSKWTLTAIPSFGWEDVKQILLLHIWKKWSYLDHSKPLAPYLNRIISHQISNLLRNLYLNHSKPCTRCAASEPDNLCNIYGEQCAKCPLYAWWDKNKKQAYNVKLPVSLENHQQEVNTMPNENIDIERSSASLHEKIQTVLKPVEWTVYKLLFIEYKSEEEVAKLLGYKTSEVRKNARFKQLQNIKKSIIIKTKKLIKDGEIDLPSY